MNKRIGMIGSIINFITVLLFAIFLLMATVYKIGFSSLFTILYILSKSFFW